MKLDARTRIRRLGHVIALLTLFVTMLGAGAEAVATQGNIITRDTTINALTNATICTPTADATESCGSVALHVSPNKEGTSIIVCVDVVTGDRYEEGCRDVAATFAMDTDELSWATLTPTAVELRSLVCPPKGEPGECEEAARTITVAASWIATGELTRVRQTLGNPHGPCTVTDKIDGLVRDTATTVSVDGASVETWGNLQVLDSKTVRRTNCG
jgi:hypothetical protein